VGEWILEFALGNIAKSAAFNLIYLVTMIISGAVLAGGIGWALTKALAASGALSRFEAGREARADV
jgi:energy-coupling factor transport system substrate-specific component